MAITPGATAHYSFSPHGASKVLFMGANGAIRPASSDERGLAGRGMQRLDAFTRYARDRRGRLVSDAYHVSQRLMAQHVSGLRRDMEDQMALMGRSDDFSSTLGNFDPNDLVQKMQRALEEPLPPLGMDALPPNTELKPGAQHYRQQRSYTTGEAIVYRGGTGADVEDIAVANAFEERPIIYIISAFSVDWMEQMAKRFSGIDNTLRMQVAQRRVQRELENRLTIDGDETLDVYGLLNHPYVDEYIIDTDFGTGDAEDMYTALVDAANYASEASSGAYRPDTLYLSDKIYNRISSKKFGSGDSERVLEAFQKACPHIKRIEVIYELTEAGRNSSGRHLMFFCRTGSGRANGGGIGDRSIEMMRVLNPLILPPERHALHTRTFLISGVAGANQSEVGHNLRVEVTITE